MGATNSNPEIQWVGALCWTLLTIFVATSGIYTLLVWKQQDRDLRRRSPADTDWYRKIKKPPDTPPPLTFAILWPILYALITASIWVCWRQGVQNSVHIFNLTLSLYITQLLLTGVWVLLFFVAHKTGTSAIVLIIILGICSVKLALFIYQSLWISFGLFVPYVLWLCYALYLNVAIVLLND